MLLTAHTTLIIAVVTGCVGLLLLIFIIYLVLRRPAKQVPLPPKQELARYRENYPNSPRPTLRLDSRSPYAPPSAFAGSSRSSLIPPESRGGSPFRRPSLNTSESPSASEDISHTDTPVVPAFHLPHPRSFDTSSTSLSTGETDSPFSSPRIASASDPNLSPIPSHQSRSPSSPRFSRRPRPLSVGSAGSSATSRRSRNTIRGAPHALHNQIQIVLPAPLAFNDRMSIHENTNSVVDQWAPMALRSEGNPIPRSQSLAVPRRSSQSSLAVPPVNASQVRRPASSYIPQGSYPPHNHESTRISPPPVPQIPQHWLPPSANPPKSTDSSESSGHGRSRDVSSHAVIISERAPQLVDRPPPGGLQQSIERG
ncbi:hypothetical protein GGX14DRAFT_640841 [Mycena pura]|uniref:Uncharacterized protein n=1 Tax=Mycena pura TaxID=153505 RepID=A0AAD6YPW0_9AGAR|nr:hypothetical protein GGX14DRAFT_640841 [Mycena pura]